MQKEPETYIINDIELQVIYSHRRTLGISVLPDSSVVVRVPYRTSLSTIRRIVQQKSAWIIKYRDSYRVSGTNKNKKFYTDGETHLFRGNENLLRIEPSKKKFVIFNDGTIRLGLERTGDADSIKKLLYKGYKEEAQKTLPEMFGNIVSQYESEQFKPAGLIIRTMKRRWGSCSHKGVITLSTELIKLPDRHIEYVIIHELCHLKQHNHGSMYYRLLSELFPDWKSVRKDLKSYIH